jgi:hypothetical protein
MPERQMRGEGGTGAELYIGTLYGLKTDVPLVEIKFGQERGQFTPKQATQLAMWLLEACQASIADGMLMQFARDELRADDHGGAQLIQHFRAYRAMLAERGIV